MWALMLLGLFNGRASKRKHTRLLKVQILLCVSGQQTKQKHLNDAQILQKPKEKLIITFKLSSYLIIYMNNNCC